MGHSRHATSQPLHKARPREGSKERARQQSALQPRSTCPTDLPEELLRQILETGALFLPELAKLAPTGKLFRDVYRERRKAEEDWLTEAATSFFSETAIKDILGDLVGILGRRGTAHASAELQSDTRRTWHVLEYQSKAALHRSACPSTADSSAVVEQGYLSDPNSGLSVNWERTSSLRSWIAGSNPADAVACLELVHLRLHRWLLRALTAIKERRMEEFPIRVEGGFVLDDNDLWSMDWRGEGPLVCTIAPSTPTEEVACLGLVHLACKRVTEVLREVPSMPGTRPPSRRRSARRAGCRISWNEVDEAPEDVRRALSVLHMWNHSVGSSLPDFDLLWEVRS
eukprot:jgi/Botrbrau1/3998/Bobra.0016s0010.1